MKTLRLALDHLVVAAEELAAGAAAVEAALGVPLQPGGRHERMGTANRLLSLGPDAYLEVIAVDPAAPTPAEPRWFGLDAFAGPSRLVAWVVRVEDLELALARLGPEWGAPADFERGAYRWRMALPPRGVRPFDGIAPALIEWRSPPPAAKLADRGCRLGRLDVVHPRIEDLRALLPELADLLELRLRQGPPGLAADFAAPAGRRRLP